MAGVLMRRFDGHVMGVTRFASFHERSLHYEPFDKGERCIARNAKHALDIRPAYFAMLFGELNNGVLVSLSIRGGTKCGHIAERRNRLFVGGVGKGRAARPMWI